MKGERSGLEAKEKPKKRIDDAPGPMQIRLAPFRARAQESSIEESTPLSYPMDPCLVVIDKAKSLGESERLPTHTSCRQSRKSRPAARGSARNRMTPIASPGGRFLCSLLFMLAFQSCKKSGVWSEPAATTPWPRSRAVPSSSTIRPPRPPGMTSSSAFCIAECFARSTQATTPGVFPFSISILSSLPAIFEFPRLFTSIVSIDVRPHAPAPLRRQTPSPRSMHQSAVSDAPANRCLPLFGILVLSNTSIFQPSIGYDEKISVNMKISRKNATRDRNIS